MLVRATPANLAGYFASYHAYPYYPDFIDLDSAYGAASGDGRLTREVRAAGAAGGVLFAWLDEWFKHTWVTIDLEVPAERSRLWHNMEDAEQHYGLMGEYAGASADATPQPGGDPAVWRA